MTKDVHINAYLNAAIKIEQHKKDLAEQLKNRDAQIIILTGLLSDTLRTFEEKFASDEAEFNFEQMAGYICAAGYLERKAGRPSLCAAVREQLEKLNF